MLEALLSRINVQFFIFAAFVIFVIARPGLKSDALSEKELNAVVIICLVALGLYAFRLVVMALRPSQRAASADRASPLKDDPARTSHCSLPAARGFMLLGLLIYWAYYWLDSVVITRDVVGREEVLTHIFQLRVAGVGIIATVFCLSFFKWFPRHYVVLIGSTCALCGIGVAAMLHLAGPGIHFYCQGLIQVIAFGAFAFRLPAKAMSLICATLLGVYLLVVAGQLPQLDAQQSAAIINNVVSLVTFSVLAVGVSVSLHSGAETVGGAS